MTFSEGSSAANNDLKFRSSLAADILSSKLYYYKLGIIYLFDIKSTVVFLSQSATLIIIIIS